MRQGLLSQPSLNSRLGPAPARGAIAGNGVHEMPKLNDLRIQARTDPTPETIRAYREGVVVQLRQARCNGWTHTLAERWNDMAEIGFMMQCLAPPAGEEA